MCRLEAYDRNFNFGQERIEQEEFKMKLPADTNYRDVNSSMQLLLLRLANINSWLAEHSKSVDKAPSLYASKFLMFLRSTILDGASFF